MPSTTASSVGIYLLMPLKTAFSMVTLSSYGIFIFLIVLIALLNFKSLPLIWTFRLFTFLFQSRNWLTPTYQITNIFQPIVLHSRSPFWECDYYLHKNNATFFTDIDIARWHLIATLILPIIRKPPHNLAGGKGKPNQRKTLAVVLGGLACTFKREIKPYERYEIWTRVLCWDEKWVFFVTHFVRTGKVKRDGKWSLQPWKSKTKTISKKVDRQADGKTLLPPEKAILASAVSKCIFRCGRQTVSPEAVFEAANLMPPHISPSAVTTTTSAEKSRNGDLNREQIEQQRMQGMKLAEAMVMLDLAHNAFDPANGPVLAEYHDVWAWA